MAHCQFAIDPTDFLIGGADPNECLDLKALTVDNFSKWVLDDPDTDVLLFYYTRYQVLCPVSALCAPPPPPGARSL